MAFAVAATKELLIEAHLDFFISELLVVEFDEPTVGASSGNERSSFGFFIEGIFINVCKLMTSGVGPRSS